MYVPNANGLKTRTLARRRVRMTLGNSRNFMRMQALKYRNLPSRMSQPTELRALVLEHFSI
jgi:hypothetical protein